MHSDPRFKLQLTHTPPVFSSKTGGFSQVS